MHFVVLWQPTRLNLGGGSDMCLRHKNKDVESRVCCGCRILILAGCTG